MQATALRKALRGFLRGNRLQALLIPTADPHLSEYLNEHYALRKAASGFTGSAGTLILTEKTAALWTDSRYWEQAARELPADIELIKDGDERALSRSDWLALQIPCGSRIGIDARLISHKAFETLSHTLQKRGFELVALDKDPADLWDSRPGLRFAPVYQHRAAPVARGNKLARLREYLTKAQADAFLTASLDEIAWLLNLRGSDIPHNPVFYSYLWVAKNTPSILFIAAGMLSEELITALLADNVHIMDICTIDAFLGSQSSLTVLFDEESTSEHLSRILHRQSGLALLQQTSPVALWKAVKTKEEIALIRQAMVKDGVALVRFFAWLDQAQKTQSFLTEVSVSEKLLKFRQSLEDFVDSSFETISAFGPNGALPHYQAKSDNASPIRGDSFLLIDSGAQFPEGTTDITRTVFIGSTPSQEMMDDYTAVLRAHIRLAKARFPVNLPSQVLDVLAREPLWERLCDYGHGTGHGVGFFLNVHEGPQRISYPRFRNGEDLSISASTALINGMLTSNEPGLYRPGKWGIRTENLVVCKEAGDSEFGHFLEFETVTLCPIDLKAVHLNGLLEDEIQWINDYHWGVLNALRRPLEAYPDALAWLIEKTRPIEK